MAKSADSTANCPHCDASLYYLQRGCGSCGRRVDREWVEPCPSCERDVDFTRSQCFHCRTALSLWNGIVARVRGEDPHVDLRIAKDAVVHPTEAGFVCHTGDPRGQRADYRRPLPDGTGIHVKEFDDRFDVHWDRVDPTEDFLGHVLADAPHWLLFGGLFGFKLARWPVGLLARTPVGRSVDPASYAPSVGLASAVPSVGLTSSLPTSGLTSRVPTTGLVSYIKR